MSIILAQSLKLPRGAELPNRLAKAARNAGLPTSTHKKARTPVTDLE
ncbi:MAG: hypothetical protein H6964_02175 [Chromatiaceae bacterium]|nr:hypothetical protein [Gammaproteobacteria bacterium]MCP5445788.1 hypothetical protein [Chromatiaceae bacterium]